MEFFLTLGALAGFAAFWNTLMIQKQFKQLAKDLQWMTDIKLMTRDGIMKGWQMPRAIVMVGKMQHNDANSSVQNE